MSCHFYSKHDNLDIQGLILLARYTYQELYNMLFGVNPRYCKPNHPAFKKIVKICMDENFDVEDYIKIGLQILTKDVKYISPTDLTRKDIPEQYRKRKAAEPNQEISSYKAQLQKLYNMLKTNSDIYPNARSVLVNANTPFNAWFRVLFFDTIDESIFNAYGKLAWEELRRDNRLRQMVRSVKPQQLHALESKIAYFGDEGRQ